MVCMFKLNALDGGLLNLDAVTLAHDSKSHHLPDLAHQLRLSRGHLTVRRECLPLYHRGDHQPPPPKLFGLKTLLAEDDDHLFICC